jgi:hypothetical protein
MLEPASQGAKVLRVRSMELGMVLYADLRPFSFDKPRISTRTPNSRRAR